jgi:hypothetical protein
MSQITIGSPLKSEFEGVVMPTELYDDSGRLLGHFVPRMLPPDSDECPYSPDELAAMRCEEGGRELKEIWRTLNAE